MVAEVHLGSIPRERRDTVSQLVSAQVVSSESPVLIFEVDAAGIAEEAAPARRCDVRLIGYMRDRTRDNGQRPSGEELSAVLVLRALTPSRLLSCVRAVTRGGAVPPEVLCQLLPTSSADSPPARELTDRELVVLRMLGDGETTRGIAEQLSYSERTVKNIVHDLLEKLNCRTRAHAVAIAARQGVI
jgi:DNA-binding CsgD family transcriptional regulator